MGIALILGLLGGTSLLFMMHYLFSFEKVHLLPHFFSDENITIIGAGAGLTTLDADNSLGGVFVTGTANIQLQNLTIQNTIRASASGCVETLGDGSATLINVILQDCWRSGFTQRGTGTAHLINTIIRRAIDENTDPDFILNGSGIENYGEMIIEGGEISNNARNGIENYEDGRLTISNTLIQNNALTGVVLMDGSFASFLTVTITNNGVELPRSGITIAGTAIIANSTITNNPSTGVWVYGTGNLIITTSTISGHTEGHGIYIAENGVAAINEVTISNNGNPAASASLNGVYNDGGIVRITHSTITANSRGAIHNEGPGQLWLYTSNVIGNVGDGAVILNNPGGTMTIKRSLIANNILVRLEGGGSASTWTASFSRRPWDSGAGGAARCPSSISTA